MNDILNMLADWTQWLLVNSLKASIVAGLILLVQFLFRNRLPAKWSYVLWLLLVARLIIPFEFASPLSLFNLTPDVVYFSPQHEFEKETENITSGLPAAKPSTIPEQPVRNQVEYVSVASKTPLFTLWQMIGMVWLTGAVLLFGHMVLVNLHLWRQVRSAEPAKDREILSVLDRCRHRLNIRRKIGLFQLSGINTPFWFGLFSPRIVMPVQLSSQLSKEDMEHIFCHELVHYKQRDVYILVLVSMLQMMHWFNPLLWIAFFKLRADCENACDELVLNQLGAERSEHYGRTLIALVERAARRDVVSLSVSLADATYPLKRRLKMIANFKRKSMIWTLAALCLFVFIALFSLTSAKPKGNISGQVTFIGETRPDSVYVGLYHVKSFDFTGNFFGDPKALFRSVKRNFHFQVEPGMYNVAACAYGYEVANVNFVVPDKETPIHIQFELKKLSLPGPVHDVKVTGSFCDWDKSRALPMHQERNLWRISEVSSIGHGSSYKFAISGTRPDGTAYQTVRYSPDIESKKYVPDWATFNHPFDGNPIEFDPSVFYIVDDHSTVQISGFDLNEQFQQLHDSLTFMDVYYHKIRKQASQSPEKEKALYTTLQTRFRNLQAPFDPYFEPVFIEYWIDDIFHMHPTYVDFENNIPENWKFNRTELLAAFKKSGVQDLYQTIWNLIQNLDPKSPLVQGDYIEGWEHLRWWVDLFPETEDLFQVTSKELYEFLIQFVKNTPDPGVKGHLLYHAASSYCEIDSLFKEDKAKFLLDWLIQDYPESWYVRERHAERKLNRLKVRLGEPAPEFNVQSVENNSYKLSKFRGQFVLLDFWAPICGAEHVRNTAMRQLATTIPGDSLFILGFSDINVERTKRGKRECDLPFPYVADDKEIRVLYGTDGCSDNILIGPDGKIIARDIRYNQLLATIRGEMKKVLASG